MAENAEEEGRESKKSERNQEARERRGKRRSRNPKRVGPPPLAVVHLMEDGVPHSCSHICPIIFIEAMAWSAVACSNFQGFAHLEIVCQFLLIFVRFVYDDFGFCVVYLLLAVLLMLREARVVPVAFSSGRAVFFASG